MIFVKIYYVVVFSCSDVLKKDSEVGLLECRI